MLKINAEEDDMKDDIGDRFKAYEDCSDYTLPRRMPMVIRVDGRGFHGLGLKKPFDHAFFGIMSDVAQSLCKEIQGAVLAYQQSDEVSVVVRDDMTLETQPWFGKRLSKVLSVGAAVATECFNRPGVWCGHFDARAFVLPDLSEVVNYLVWRQKDAIRNSVQMKARSVFSHKDCHRRSMADLKEMLSEYGDPWEDVEAHYQRGAVTQQVQATSTIPQTGEVRERREWHCDLTPPVFTEDRGYIEGIYYCQR